MGLQEFWFILVAVLFVGFFLLEGFDFGVGMLMAPLGRMAAGPLARGTTPLAEPGVKEKHRRAVLNTIGPVWDGNEVWLITAGGAMFAAFPGWYAAALLQEAGDALGGLLELAVGDDAVVEEGERLGRKPHRRDLDVAVEVSLGHPQVLGDSGGPELQVQVGHGRGIDG